MTEVRLSLAIMHLPSNDSRRAMVADMIRAMGGPTVLNAETEHWEVIEDWVGGGLWRTARRGWMSSFRAPSATHHVLLQDDLIVCQDFIAGLKEALTNIPLSAVNLYSPRSAINEARAENVSWAVFKDGVWGQSIILPTEWVPDFLSWTDAHVPFEYKHDDRRVSLWLMEHGRSAWATVPSLVEHAAPSDSTLGHNWKQRQAKWFIGADTSALSIDWSLGAERPYKAQSMHSLASRWRDALGG